MKTKVIIDDQGIIVNNLSTKWEDIVGIRHYNGWIIYQFCSHCPYSSLFLRGGKIIRIPSRFSLEGVAPRMFEDNYKKRFGEYFTTIELIETKAKNLNTEISAWLEWRIFLPTGIVQTILFVHGLLTYSAVNTIIGDEFDSLRYALPRALVGGILALPLGWIWERRTRKRLWK